LRELPALFRRARERVHVMEKRERERDQARRITRPIQEQRNQRAWILHESAAVTSSSIIRLSV